MHVESVKLDRLTCTNTHSKRLTGLVLCICSPTWRICCRNSSCADHLPIMSKEIVTLQVGHYSSFVGTHWWNLQEASFVYDKGIPTDIDHDVLYREGKTLQGEVTFLPRAVVVDLKGSLNTLRQNGILYTNLKKPSDIPWAGDLVVHKTEPIQKNEFLQDLENEDIQRNSRVEGGDVIPEKDICQASLTDDQEDIVVDTRVYNLEDSVNVWSDFLRGHFHPKSIFQVEQYNHGNELEAFNGYGLGQQVWSQERTSEELEDRIRFFCEECDHLQGFHIILDAFDGFAGIGQGIISLLHDEYPNKSIVSIPTFPTIFSNDELQHKIYRQCNIAFSLDFLASNTSLVIPLSLTSSYTSKEATFREFRYINYNANLMYHTSAILAAALETSTSPYRLKKDPVLMSDLAATLTPVGMKIAMQSLMLPCPVQGDSLGDSLHRLQPVLGSVTPGASIKDSPSIIQSIVARGLDNVPLHSRASLQNRPYAKCSTLVEMLGGHLANFHPCSCSLVKTAYEACATTPPFPNIFSESIAPNGIIKEEPSKQVVNSVPTLGGIHCNRGIQNTLQELCTATRRLNPKKFHSFFSCGFEVDDFKEVIESLESLASIYASEFD